MRDYLRHLLAVSYDFYERYTSGELVSRLGDADTVREAVSRIFVTLLLDIFMITAAVGVLAFVNARLFGVSMIVVAVYAAAVAAFNRPISKVSSELRGRDAAMTTSLLETIGGVEVIKACRYENEAVERGGGRLMRLMDSYCRAMKLFSSQSALSAAVTAVGEAAVLAVGGAGVMSGRISLGSLLLFYTLFGMCMSPIKEIIDLLPTMRKAEVSAGRLRDVFSEPAERADEGAEAPAGDIVFSNVVFRYGNREPVLDGLSFSIRRGTKTAVVGGSGSGKSTLARLLLRLYEPESGEITLGGRPLSEISPASLRQKTAYVPQRPFLFRGSVLENIRVGNPVMTEEDVVRALEATPFVRLIGYFPMGYHTMLAENGENLSGGQRQLVALARALVRPAELLILDEAVSALDPEAARLADEAVRAAHPEATILVVTHDPAAAAMCDEILSLDRAYGGAFVD